MKYLLSYLILSIPLFGHSEIKTMYSWINSNNEFGKGSCYQVDIKTEGQQFIQKVKKDLCKPKETTLVFLEKKGICYEVDTETSGKNFVVKVKTEDCRTKKTSYIYNNFKNQYGCYEIDTPSLGKDYYRKVDQKYCDKLEQNFVWKTISEYKGECYVILPNNDIKKVAIRKCKPDKVKYQFVRKGPTKGVCYEIASQGKHLYSVQSKMINCKNVETNYFFLKEENQLRGTCYEVDIETKGNKYLAKVKTELCL